jgi:predicted NBD/HSP70 family sugar kinase
VANLINLFNPERVVLGGWAGQALGAALLPKIRTAAQAHALRKPFEQATIKLGQLGVDAVALGAATLPIAHLLAAGGVRSRADASHRLDRRDGTPAEGLTGRHPA